MIRSMAGAGGHWVSSRPRLLTVEEMLVLQGVPADVRREGISNRQLGLMIGNAVSVNVLERLLARLLPGVGLLPRGSDADLLALGPKRRGKLLACLEKLCVRGCMLDTDAWIINVFGRSSHGMKGAVTLLGPLHGWSWWPLGVQSVKVAHG